MKTTKVPGIYRITNSTNGRFYIGSAKNLAGRFATHRKDLRKNQHHNTHLQAAWNKYGEDSFVFSVEEVVNGAEELFEREQYYLDTLKPYEKGVGYNKSKSARTSLGFKPSLETRKRQSESAKRRFREKPMVKGEEHPNSRLTWDIVAEIRAKYAAGESNSVEMSKIYNVNHRYIRSILDGSVWGNGASAPVRPRILSLAQIADINVRRAAGQSWNSIGQQYGKDYRLLCKLIANDGFGDRICRPRKKSS